jgi:hypothetical protein
MIDPHDFAQKQMELTTEFAKFVVDYPEVRVECRDELRLIKFEGPRVSRSEPPG